MKALSRERKGQLLFVGAVGVGLALYALTVPDGLPWNASSHLALAYLGEIARLPAMPNPIWGRFVEVFAGHQALACACAAFAAGLLGALVNRYLGWRLGATAALVWLFMPGVWDRALTGERGVCLASLAVAALWLVNAVGLWATRRARAVKDANAARTASSAPVVHAKLAKVNRVAGWSFLGAAVLFAIVSASFHDYRLGEPASAFAKGVVEAAGDRIIVMNGLCDDQLRRISHARMISLRMDEAARQELLAWVKSAYPSETNLWVAAEVSPHAFVQRAIRRDPDRFYLMNGASTTLEAWERRWASFEPYLNSSDRFVPVARLAFVSEGERVAKRLEEAGDAKGAKRLRERLPRVETKARKRVVRQVAEGKTAGVAPEVLSLVEWSNEMVSAMARHELERAGRIARVILSNPQWTHFLPANAVMGAVAASEGDYASSAAFFNVAVSTTNAVPVVTLNDYADTLMQLGRLEEAERVARRAVDGSDETFWLARLTLAEVLIARYMKSELVKTVENGEKIERYVKPKGANEAAEEIRRLLKSVLAHAPEKVHVRVKTLQREMR